jgi:hypothetical protein
MKLQEWYGRMNQRERLLASLVGGVLFLLVNIFGWSWIMGAISASREDLAARQHTRLEQSVYLKERDLWTKRQQWLEQHQPVYKGEGEASTLLESQIRPIAAKYAILIENPGISAGETTPNYRSVHATFETRSHWDSLVRFLFDVQQPEAFIVFESVNLAVDAGDPSMMRGKFKVARWFAPGGGAR